MAELAEIKALLGEPKWNWSDPAPWDALERELGVTFPADFREIIDAYGSVVINKQLSLFHPGNFLANLGERIRDEIVFWAEFAEDWRDAEEGEYLPAAVGAGPGELLPIAHSTTGESVFLRVPAEPGGAWTIGIQEFDSPAYWAWDMSFGDWLLAYLQGEDVTVCSRNRAPDGPFYENWGDRRPRA